VAKALLRSLPESLLTRQLFPFFLLSASRNDVSLLSRTLALLADDNLVLLQRFFELLFLICLEPKSKMTAESLGKVVGPNLLESEDPRELIKIKNGELPIIALFILIIDNFFNCFPNSTLPRPKTAPGLYVEPRLRTSSVASGASGGGGGGGGEREKTPSVSETAPSANSLANATSDTIVSVVSVGAAASAAAKSEADATLPPALAPLDVAPPAVANSLPSEAAAASAADAAATSAPASSAGPLSSPFESAPAVSLLSPPAAGAIEPMSPMSPSLNHDPARERALRDSIAGQLPHAGNAPFAAGGNE
jgi:hypothetical protein